MRRLFAVGPVRVNWWSFSDWQSGLFSGVFYIELGRLQIRIG